MRPFLPILFVALALVSRALSQSTADHFSAESKSFPSDATLPAAALRILEKDDEIRRMLPNVKSLAPYLLVAIVQLGDASETDYVVMGTRRLAAANLAPFWILRQRGATFDLVLKVSAHDLLLRTNVTHHLRDLEVVTLSANTITIGDFRFDGTRYQPEHWNTQKIK